MSVYSASAGSAGLTELYFDQPISREAQVLICKANGGFMGIINLCKELKQVGCVAPSKIVTDVNIRRETKEVNVVNYWPSQGE